MLIFDKNETSPIMQEFKTKELKASKKWGIDHLSVSSRTLPTECGKKIEFKKLYRSANLKTSLGNIIHQTLEYIQNKIIVGETNYEDISIDLFIEILQKNIALWFKNKDIDIISQKLLVPESDLELFIDNWGTISLLQDKLATIFSNAYKNKKFDPKKLLSPNAVATEVLGVLNRDLPWLGYIDRIDIIENENTVKIIDYKTVWSKTSKTKWDKTLNTFQGWLYKEMAQEFFPNKNILVEFKFIGVFVGKNWLTSDKAVDVVQWDRAFSYNDDDSDTQFRDELEFYEYVWKGKKSVIAQSMYGCASCSYASKCDYYKKIKLMEDSIKLMNN